MKELAGIPDFRAEWGERIVDAHMLLKLRDSDTCRAFRDWLRNTDSRTDEEIRHELESFRQKVAMHVGSTPGRAIRFLASSMLRGVVGILAGVLDSFIIDRIFHKSALVSFIADEYPSIFKLPDTKDMKLNISALPPRSLTSAKAGSSAGASGR